MSWKVFFTTTLFMSIHGKRMMKTATNVCNAELAATFQTIVLKTKNRQFVCLAMLAHIPLSKTHVVTTKRKNHLLFRRNFAANHNKLHRDLCRKKNHSTFNIIVSSPLWLILLTKKSIPISYYTLSVYSKASRLSQYPLTVNSKRERERERERDKENWSVGGEVVAVEDLP